MHQDLEQCHKNQSGAKQEIITDSFFHEASFEVINYAMLAFACSLSSCATLKPTIKDLLHDFKKEARLIYF